LAEVQKAQGTLYCGGLDIHPFGGYEESLRVYGGFSPTTGPVFDFYENLSGLLNLQDDSARKRLVPILTAVESYTCEVVRILVEECNIRVFKPNAAFYEQFGPMGNFLLMRVEKFVKELAAEKNIRLIVILDCKKGDIFTTQAAYLRAIMGNLSMDWGVDYAPFDFDIMNVTPWMGLDVLALEDKGEPAIGLQLMQAGKGIIVVNKTSNPSGPRYQEITSLGTTMTVQMFNVRDLREVSKKFDLEYDGLSTIGLVVGSTHPCDGSIRETFPTTTILVPGFGAQGGKFGHIMLELIRKGKWNGQGAIFSLSRGTMYAWLEKYGGSGDPANLEQDLVAAASKFRENEEEAFSAPEVIDAGIVYPFSN